MPNRSDEVFHFNGDKLTPMPFRSMGGLKGRTKLINLFAN
jgi:hypothetical protein